MYLEKIDRALHNVNYPYAVNNVRLVCRDIIQNEKLTKRQKETINNFMENISKTEYLNFFTNEIDNSKLNNFRELSKKLWIYINDKLGFE